MVARLNAQNLFAIEGGAPSGKDKEKALFSVFIFDLFDRIRNELLSVINEEIETFLSTVHWLLTVA